jgi:pilus assembly protein CpaB
MRKSKVILGIGIVTALMAGILSYGWMRASAGAQRRAWETQPVVVAAADLKWGTTISGDNVKTAPFLKRTLAPGYFPDVAGIAGRTLVYPVKSNEPINESQLAPRTADGGGIAAVITPQKRAMAVKVDKVIGVSGFIHPGNRVDVLATFNRLNNNDPTPATKTVLENVLVLATGTDMEKTGKGEKPAAVDVITLEVTSEEGEKLALAATEGRLQLALRNQADSAEVLTNGTTVTRLMSSASPKEPAPVRHVAPAARTATRPPVKVAAANPVKPMLEVQVIRGTVMSTYKYERGE